MALSEGTGEIEGKVAAVRERKQGLRLRGSCSLVVQRRRRKKKTRGASLVGGKSVLLLTCPSGHGKRNTVREDPGESDGSVRRLANKLFPPQKAWILLVTTSPLYPLSPLAGRWARPLPGLLPPSSIMSTTMRSSSLKPRKNNAKRSAKPSAAVQRRVRYRDKNQQVVGRRDGTARGRDVAAAFRGCPCRGERIEYYFWACWMDVKKGSSSSRRSSPQRVGR